RRAIATALRSNSVETVYGACGLRPNPPNQSCFPSKNEIAFPTSASLVQRGWTSINSANHQMRSDGRGIWERTLGTDSMFKIEVVPHRRASAMPAEIEVR